MFKTSFCKWAAVALPVLGLMFASACGNQPSHPNQINSFDGATYDSLLLAHGAMASLGSSITSSYPKYSPMYNQANAAYSAAFAAYSTFRTTPTTQAEVAITINNLTVAIVALENAFQIDMQASATKMAAIRAHAKRLRGSAAKAGLSVSDILTELEVAAAIAQTIPQAGPYAKLAALVMQTTSAAIVAETSAAGQPIDLTLLQPMPAIP